MKKNIARRRWEYGPELSTSAREGKRRQGITQWRARPRGGYLHARMRNLASGNTKLLEQVFLPLLPIFLVGKYFNKLLEMLNKMHCTSWV